MSDNMFPNEYCVLLNDQNIPKIENSSARRYLNPPSVTRRKLVPYTVFNPCPKTTVLSLGSLPQLAYYGRMCRPLPIQFSGFRFFLFYSGQQWLRDMLRTLYSSVR